MTPKTDLDMALEEAWGIGYRQAIADGEGRQVDMLDAPAQFRASHQQSATPAPAANNARVSRDLALLLEDALDAVGVQLGVKSRYATAAARLHERGVRVGGEASHPSPGESAGFDAEAALRLILDPLDDGTGLHWSSEYVSAQLANAGVRVLLPGQKVVDECDCGYCRHGIRDGLGHDDGPDAGTDVAALLEKALFEADEHTCHEDSCSLRDALAALRDRRGWVRVAAPRSEDAAHPDDDFVARAQRYRDEHEATHEDEMCGGPCIVLGLAGDEDDLCTCDCDGGHHPYCNLARRTCVGVDLASGTDATAIRQPDGTWTLTPSEDAAPPCAHDWQPWLANTSQCSRCGTRRDDLAPTGDTEPGQ